MILDYQHLKRWVLWLSLARLLVSCETTGRWKSISTTVSDLVSAEYINFWQHVQVNETCPRYSLVPFTSGGGSGHLFGDVVFTFVLAAELNAAVVFDDTDLSHISIHGSAVWLPSFLNLPRALNLSTLTLNKGLRVIEAQNWSHALSFTAACSVLIIVRDHNCDKHGIVSWCFSLKGGAYEAYKWHARLLFMRTQSRRYHSIVFDPELYNVAIHLRTGDISLHSNDRQYYTTLLNHVNTAIPIFFSPKFYLFYEGTAENNFSLPNEFSFMQEILPGATLIGNQDAETCLLHFINADMVITAGSSLTSAAHTLSYTRVQKKVASTMLWKHQTLTL
jgi:hypothetical protein